MKILLVGLSIVFGIIGLGLIMWILIYILSPSINGKEDIEQYMSEKYGDEWLEQCIKSLKNAEVRKSIADEYFRN